VLFASPRDAHAQASRLEQTDRNGPLDLSASRSTSIPSSIAGSGERTRPQRLTTWWSARCRSRWRFSAATGIHNLAARRRRRNLMAAGGVSPDNQLALVMAVAGPPSCAPSCTFGNRWSCPFCPRKRPYSGHQWAVSKMPGADACTVALPYRRFLAHNSASFVHCSALTRNTVPRAFLRILKSAQTECNISAVSIPVSGVKRTSAIEIPVFHLDEAASSPGPSRSGCLN
jgi:hypothetical protein